MSTTSPADHWPLHARRWSLVGPPLRPCAEDVAITQAEVAPLGDAPVHALVLGVTPELVALRLPAGSTVTAIDRSPAMIASLFVAAPDRRALVGDWLSLPLPHASIDLVVGDGVCSLLAVEDYGALAAELARVLRPGGRVVLRLFAAPARAETLDDVRAALPAIGSFDVLKWRIAMALQTKARAVRVRDIRDAFDRLVPDRAALAAATGWPREVIDHVDIYRDSPASYSFPTVDEVRAAFAPALACTEVHTPRYELGERCPTLVLARALTR